MIKPNKELVKRYSTKVALNNYKKRLGVNSIDEINFEYLSRYGYPSKNFYNKYSGRFNNSVIMERSFMCNDELDIESEYGDLFDGCIVYSYDTNIVFENSGEDVVIDILDNNLYIKIFWRISKPEFINRDNSLSSSVTSKVLINDDIFNRLITLLKNSGLGNSVMYKSAKRISIKLFNSEGNFIVLCSNISYSNLIIRRFHHVDWELLENREDIRYTINDNKESVIKKIFDYEIYNNVEYYINIVKDIVNNSINFDSELIIYNSNNEEVIYGYNLRDIILKLISRRSVSESKCLEILNIDRVYDYFRDNQYIDLDACKEIGETMMTQIVNNIKNQIEINCPDSEVYPILLNPVDDKILFIGYSIDEIIGYLTINDLYDDSKDNSNLITCDNIPKNLFHTKLYGDNKLPTINLGGCPDERFALFMYTKYYTELVDDEHYYNPLINLIDIDDLKDKIDELDEKVIINVFNNNGLSIRIVENLSINEIIKLQYKQAMIMSSISSSFLGKVGALNEYIWDEIGDIDDKSVLVVKIETNNETFGEIANSKDLKKCVVENTSRFDYLINSGYSNLIFDADDAISDLYINYDEEEKTVLLVLENKMNGLEIPLAYGYSVIDMYEEYKDYDSDKYDDSEDESDNDDNMDDFIVTSFDIKIDHREDKFLYKIPIEKQAIDMVKLAKYYTNYDTTHKYFNPYSVLLELSKTPLSYLPDNFTIADKESDVVLINNISYPEFMEYASREKEILNLPNENNLFLVNEKVQSELEKNKEKKDLVVIKIPTEDNVFDKIVANTGFRDLVYIYSGHFNFLTKDIDIGKYINTIIERYDYSIHDRCVIIIQRKSNGFEIPISYGYTINEVDEEYRDIDYYLNLGKWKLDVLYIFRVLQSAITCSGNSNHNCNICIDIKKDLKSNYSHIKKYFNEIDFQKYLVSYNVISERIYISMKNNKESKENINKLIANLMNMDYNTETGKLNDNIQKNEDFKVKNNLNKTKQILEKNVNVKSIIIKAAIKTIDYIIEYGGGKSKTLEISGVIDYGYDLSEVIDYLIDKNIHNCVDGISLSEDENYIIIETSRDKTNSINLSKLLDYIDTDIHNIESKEGKFKDDIIYIMKILYEIIKDNDDDKISVDIYKSNLRSNEEDIEKIIDYIDTNFPSLIITDSKRMISFKVPFSERSSVLTTIRNINDIYGDKKENKREITKNDKNKIKRLFKADKYELINLNNYRNILTDISNYKNKDWEELSGNYNLSPDFIDRFADKIYWKYLIANPNLSTILKTDWFFDKYIDILKEIKNNLKLKDTVNYYGVGIPKDEL